VSRIRIDLTTDTDTAFKVNTAPDPAPDPDTGFFMTKIKEIFKLEFFFLHSQNALKTLIEDFHAQGKTIRPSAKWAMRF